MFKPILHFRYLRKKDRSFYCSCSSKAADGDAEVKVIFGKAMVRRSPLSNKAIAFLQEPCDHPIIRWLKQLKPADDGVRAS